MAYFTPLAWQTRASSYPELGPAPVSPMPPVVTASQSGETDDEYIQQPQQHLRIPIRTLPHTPEGLRSRPSIALLRRELQISPRPARSFLVQKPTMPEKTSVLPPVPSASWSAPTGNPDILNSPPVSTNGFYQSHQESVAVSPDLMPGKARTAVGALVGKRQQKINGSGQPHFLPVTRSSSTGGYEGDGDHSSKVVMAQQRHANQAFGQHCYEYAYEKTQVFADDKPYYPLERDPVLSHRTPPRTSTRAPAKAYLSPVSMSESLMGSPSSLARPFPLSKSGNFPSNQSVDSAHAGLIPKTSIKGYDFGSVVVQDQSAGVTEVVLAHPSDVTHISAMSQSIPEHDFLRGEKRARTVTADMGDDMNDSMDDSLRSKKIQNQRKVREELVQAVLERLQDDINIVLEVERIGNAANEVGEWFVRTNIDQPGLLTGFALEARREITLRLDTMLEEMNVARPEDYVDSPSEIPRYCESHTELCEALVFTRALVQMAIPYSEQRSVDDPQFQGRWMLAPGVKETVGVVKSTSPENKRGGDGNSVQFTLPSESADTPMTSNVSFTTTIATSKNLDQHEKLQKEGEKIRKTIEVLGTLIERMSMTLRQIEKTRFARTEETVKLTRDVKRYYIQMVALSHDDLCAVVDAFELDLPRPKLTKVDSMDENRERHIPPAPVPFSLPSLPPYQTPLVERNLRWMGDVDHAFSPHTQDMLSRNESIDGVDDEEEYDDLRRTMGSNDYDDEEEVRDGPFGV